MSEKGVEVTTTVDQETTAAQADTNLGDSHWQIPIRRAPFSLSDIPLRHTPTRLSDIDEEANANQNDPADDSSTIGSWEEIPTPLSETEPRAGPQVDAPEELEEITEEVVRPDVETSLYDAIMRKDVDAIKAMLEKEMCLERETRDGYTALVISILERQPNVTKLLLDKGADVNHRVGTLPPIVHAIMQEKDAPELIQLLIDHGVSLVTVSGPEDMNALHWAVTDGMIDAVDFLVSKGMDMNSTCSRGRTPLILAAEKGWTAIAKLLVAKGAELYNRSDNGGTALTWAACNGHFDAVKFLVEQGIDVDDADNDGLTPLSTACNLGRAQIVRWLLEKGADVNKLSTIPKDFSPAMAAAIAGHAKVLDVLIHHDADLTIPSGSGNTVLQAAIKEGHIEAAKLLLKAIGGPDYPHDSVALQVAVAGTHTAIMSLISTASIMYQSFNTKGSGQFAWLDWMLESGGDLVRPMAMTNVLHASLYEDNLDLVKALFAHGCDPSQHLSSGHTPLSFAIRHRKLDLIRMLLEAGADPSKPAIDSEGINLTPLHQSITALEDDEDKDTTIVDMLLDSGRCKISEGKNVHSSVFAYVLRKMNEEDNGLAEILAFRMLESVKDMSSDRCDDGSTLMHAAVEYDRLDLVDILLEKGADINVTNGRGQTPFLLKCLLRTTTLLPRLIERGADIFTKDNAGRSCLHMAADSGNINALELLLEKGLNIEETTADGYTPLMCALDARAQGAALFLLDSGANHRVTCPKKSRTILHFAASLRMGRVVDRILSAYDMDINAKDSKEWTPLALACRKGSPALVTTLLAAGADPETPEDAGDRPLHISLITKNEAVSLLLIEHGVDTAAMGSRKRTPLHLAAEYANARVTRLLLEKDATAINAPDEFTWTPLMLCQDADIAELLIEHGAEVGYADKDGWTPLHQAVACGGVNLYKMLLKCGADMNARTTDDGLSVGERMERISDLLLRERFREATSEEMGFRRRLEARREREKKFGLA